jgi:hypothetical protein
MTGTLVVTFDRSNPGIEKTLADHVFGSPMAQKTHGTVGTAHYLFNRKAEELAAYLGGVAAAGRIAPEEADSVVSQVQRLAHPIVAAA